MTLIIASQMLAAEYIRIRREQEPAFEPTKDPILANLYECLKSEDSGHLSQPAREA